MTACSSSILANRTTLLRKHYEFQHGCFISEYEEHAGGILAFSNITPIPMWNHSTWIGEPDSDFRTFLERTKERQSQKDRRPVVYIAEPTLDQASVIRASGFEKFDEEAWMLCRPSDASIVRDNQVHEVVDDEMLRQFIETFTASFQVKGAGYRSSLASVNGQAVRSRHFILFDEVGRPASVGTLVTDGEIGCIYNVGTPPAQRKRGYGQRIINHIVAAGKEIGSELLYLQVENNSSAMRLYQRCGFETAFVRVGFRLAEWKAARVDRTKLSNVLGYRPGREITSRQYLRETRALPASTPAFKRAGPATERIYLAAWVYLVHRYTGDDLVSFTLCENRDDSRRKISVKVEPSRHAREWLSSLSVLAATHDADARESLLCLNREHSANHLGDHEYPLEVHVLARSGTLEVIYRSDLFSKDAIRRMAVHFVNIVDCLTQQAGKTLSEIELLSPEEKHQLLVDWNRAEFKPVAENVAHLFESQVERNPDASALVFFKAGQSQPAEQISYRQLNRKANRLAHHLQEIGVGPNVCVGICLDRSPDLVVSILAVLKAGGVCVPLDPSYPQERLRFMLQDTNAPVILTHKSLFPELKGTTHARLICLDDSSITTRPESEKNPPAHLTDSAAYIIFTSGSTGKPKGVVITNYALANHCLDCCNFYGLSAKDRVLQFSSFNFDAAFEQLFPTLISGACLMMRDNEVWNTREFADKLSNLQLTVADIPTAYWHQLATEWAADPGAVPNNRLRLLIVGGEAISPEKVALWHKAPLNTVRLVNAYGPTEATITATSFDIPAPGLAELQFETVPIGRPRGDRKLYVLDRYGNATPIGVPGELHIGGSTLARGYHRRPELTAERFIPNPFSDDPDSRLYRTGDLVRYLEDGNLEFLGRIDDQVKIRGFRIELGEVETCLTKYHSVREAIVLARPNSSGEKQLVAYLLAVSNPAIPELRAFLKGKLPEYMLPAHFVVLEQWPLLPNGKIDRLSLPEPRDEQGPVKGPEDPLELQLQLLFERILKRGSIGVDASFFELGGDSLQALELLVAIEKATGRQLPLGTLYQSSTVQTLAREVRGRDTNQSWSSLVPLQVLGKRLPLFLLHTTPGDILGYGNLVYRLDADQPCYGLQSLGLKETALSHKSISEMARFYKSLIREFQPHGPYCLGGWCYGGILAVEIARLLKSESETVALLALLETVAMPSHITNFTYHRHRLRCFLKMSPQRWFSYFRAKARYARQSRLANRMRFRQVENCPDGTLRDPRLIQLEHVYNTNLTALNRYRSEFYDGKVTLFNAADKDPALIPDPHYGWIGLAREIEIHEVPGNHDTMLTEPNVSALARLLNECLLRAQSIHR